MQGGHLEKWARVELNHRPHAYQAALCVAIFRLHAQDKAKSVVCVLIPHHSKEPDTH